MAPPQKTEDLLAFAQHLETYSPVFRAIQSQIMEKYQFEFLYDDCDNIFELERTQVRFGNETREVAFATFGCIIDNKFYWANQMNQHSRRQTIGGQTIGGDIHRWNANLAPLFDTICVAPTMCPIYTIPYLVSLVHSPEQNVVEFRSRDDVPIFALVDIQTADLGESASFHSAPLLRIQ